MTDFRPSPLQSAIGTAVRAADHNIMVRACAGSGKTTTLLWLLSQIPRTDSFLAPSIVFLAFNKSIADTLASRCPAGVTCSTFHSLGFRALKNSGAVDRKAAVDSRKCAKILWKLTDKDDPDFQGILKLVSLLKGQSVALEPTRVRDLCFHYDVDFINEHKSIDIALEVVARSTKDLSSIDFDDMLYLPVRLGVELDSFDWIFVDEAQDTNEVQVEILDRLQLPWISSRPDEQYSPSRLVAVGDSHQAIYGFRGTNSDAMSRIASRFAMQEYPLDVSYRCPKVVVAEAQRYLSLPI